MARCNACGGLCLDLSDEALDRLRAFNRELRADERDPIRISECTYCTPCYLARRGALFAGDIAAARAVLRQRASQPKEAPAVQRARKDLDD